MVCFMFSPSNIIIVTNCVFFFTRAQNRRVSVYISSEEVVQYEWRSYNMNVGWWGTMLSCIVRTFQNHSTTLTIKAINVNKIQSQEKGIRCESTLRLLLVYRTYHKFNAIWSRQQIENTNNESSSYMRGYDNGDGSLLLVVLFTVDHSLHNNGLDKQLQCRKPAEWQPLELCCRELSNPTVLRIQWKINGRSVSCV